MDPTILMNLVAQYGFPIVLAGFLVWFVTQTVSAQLSSISATLTKLNDNVGKLSDNTERTNALIEQNNQVLREIPRQTGREVAQQSLPPTSLHDFVERNR